MDSDFLLQTSLHRNQIKRPLLESIATSRNVDSQHLATVLQSLSRLIRAQDVAFSYQYKIALAYLLLNHYDIYPPGAQQLEQQVHGSDFQFKRQSSIKQNARFNDNDAASVRSGYTTASGGQDDDDEDDEDEYTPIVPPKMDLLLSHLSILDPEPIRTDIVPTPLPAKAFPTLLPTELQESLPPVDSSKATELNTILSAPLAPSSTSSFTTITNDALSKQFSIPQLIPLSPLQYRHQNTHTITQYNTIFPKTSHSVRIILTSEPLSIQDCHDLLLACFAPVLFLLALHNIVSLALSDPAEHGDLFFQHPDHPKPAHKGPNYILFQSKVHLRIFLQQYLCNNIEFIPLSTKHFQPFFFSSQLPPSLYSPYCAFQLPPPFQHQDVAKFKDAAVVEAVKNMYPTQHQPDLEQFPSILTQLTAQPPDTAVIRSRLQGVYSAARRNQSSTTPQKQSQHYQYPRQSAPLDHTDQSFDYFLAEYTEIPPLEEEMDEWESVLIKYFDEYCFHPASSTNPSHITSSQYSQQPLVHASDEIEDILPKTQLSPAVPHASDYSRPITRTGQYAQTFIDVDTMPSSQFIRLYINIARQNNYRVLSANSSNTKIITKASPITLSEYVGWQYHQMQDQYVLYTYLRCYLTYTNHLFMQKILQDGPGARAKYLICVTHIPSVGQSDENNTLIYLNKEAYNSIISTPIMGTSQFDIKYTQRPIQRFLVNDVYANVDITAFFANRTIYPTNLSLLSYSLLSSSFIQPRLATHCFMTYNTRIPAQARKQGNNPPPGTLPGFALNGVLHDFLALSKPAFNSTINVSLQYSLFELVLYAQSTIASGLIPYLTAKWSESDFEFLAGGHDRKTLHSLFYSLLAKESSSQFQNAIRSPTKKPLLSNQNSTTVNEISSPIDSDHQLNNLTHLGQLRYETLNEDQILQYLPKIAQTLRSIYTALVEYMVSFGLSNIFNKFSSHRLTFIQYSISSTLPPLKFAQFASAYNYNVEGAAAKAVELYSDKHTLILNWKPIESTQQTITDSFLNKLTGFITPPSYQIYQSTPYLLIDVYEHQRTLTNRLAYTSGGSIVALQPFDVVLNMYKISKLYDIIEWHFEKRFIEWCDGNQSSFRDLKKLRKDWEEKVLVKYVKELLDYEKSPQDLIMKIKQHPEWLNTPQIPLNKLAFKDYKKVITDKALLERIEAMRGPLRQKSVFFARDYQAHVSSIYVGLTEEMSANTFSDIFSKDALGPNSGNPPNSQAAMSDPDLSVQDFSHLKRFFVFDIMKRMGVFLQLSAVYKIDQGFSHVLSLQSPNDKEALAKHGVLAAPPTNQGDFGALLERQKTFDKQASLSNAQKSISPKQQTKDLSSTWDEVKDFDDDVDLDESLGGIEDLFSMNSSDGQNFGEQSNSVSNFNLKSNLPTSPFVGQRSESDQPHVPMSPLKSPDSTTQANFITPKRANNNVVDMNALFATPGNFSIADDGIPNNNSNKVTQDDSNSPHPGTRKLPSASPRLPNRKIHSAGESDDDDDHDHDHNDLIDIPIRDKLNMSMDDLLPETHSPYSRNKQLPRSPQQFPTQLLQHAPSSPPSPSSTAPSTVECESPDVYLDWLKSKQAPTALAEGSTDGVPEDTGNQHAPRSTSTAADPTNLPSPTPTLLFDNPLIVYSDEQLRKLTPMQQSRYRVRRRLLDSLYSTQLQDTTEFSESSDDDKADAVGGEEGEDDGEVAADEGREQGEKRTNVFSHLATRLVNRWRKRDPFNFTNVMSQNTIDSIKLEFLLTLSESERAELLLIAQRNTNVAEPSGSDGSQSKKNSKINSTEQLNIIEKYVQFDPRFVAVVPFLYPTSQRQ